MVVVVEEVVEDEVVDDDVVGSGAVDVVVSGDVVDVVVNVTGTVVSVDSDPVAQALATSATMTMSSRRLMTLRWTGCPRA
ncbi:MAG: hypothetical protein KDB69_08385 [Acidimicrobiia bacterium]|nr:hypothetical protein [Acidimicrobiia bacterium]